MTLAGDCEREVRTLHGFFVGWYRGERDDFERLERALAPGFEMVTPSGTRRDQGAVLDGIERDRGKHEGADPPFEIDVENVRHRVTESEACLLTYEEHQSGPGGTTARVSSVLFRRDASAPGGVAWVHLHETWLDDGSG